MAAAAPFYWDQGKAVSPEALARSRKVAEALMAVQPNPQNMWQGIQSAIGQVGGSLLNVRSDNQEKASRDAYGVDYAALGDKPSTQQLEALAGNDFGNPGQQAVVQALLSNQIKQQDPAYALDTEYKRAQIDALNAKPAVTPTDDMRELDVINSERTAAGQPRMSMEELLASKRSNGLQVTTNPDGTTSISMGGTGKALTEGQSKDVYFINQGAQAAPTLDKFGDALTNLGESVGGAIPTLGNYLKSTEYQQAEQAGNQFINSILRKESGAAVPDPEKKSYGATYLPQPGDKPEVLAQKKKARANALLGIKMGLPPAAILAMQNAGVDLSTLASDAVGAPAAQPADTQNKYPGVTIEALP